MIPLATLTVTESRSDSPESRDSQYEVNAYFAVNPSRVLGAWTVVKDRRGSQLSVQWRGTTSALEGVCAAIAATDVQTTSHSPVPRPEASTEALEPIPATAPEQSALTLYAAAKALLRAQTLGDCRVELDAAQTTYRAFTSCWGTLRGAFSHSKRSGAHGVLAETPLATSRQAAFLLSLETAHGKPSALLSGDALARRKVPTSCTLADALYISLDETNSVDLARVADLTRIPVDQVAPSLLAEGLCYRVPPSCVSGVAGILIPAADYLTGDVGAKLKTASAAGPEYSRNVSALRDALPDPLGPEEVSVGLGAAWVPAEIFRDWLSTIFPGVDWGLSAERTPSHTWAIGCTNPAALRADTVIHTDRVTALEVLDSAMNNRVPVVYDDVKDAEGWPHKVRNEVATIEAQSRVQELRSRFDAWVFGGAQGKSGQSGASRTSALVDIYNDRFNGHAQRDLSGDHFTFDGLASRVGGQPYSLRERQRRGVAKILAGGTRDKSAFLVYPPGFGKTDPAICAAVKLRQLGLARRTLFAVPKSSVGQWQARFLALFPGVGDEVLCSADAVYEASGRAVARETFLARVATGGWPYVIVTHEMLREILLSEPVYEALLAEELRELRVCLREAECGVSKDSTRQARRGLRARESALERASVAHRAKWQALRDRERSPVSWEDCGVDHLVADECHAFKAVPVATRIERVAGLPSRASARAYDFWAKCQTVLGAGGRVTCLSGTPLTNTLAEAYVWMKTLQPGLLAHLGLLDFDSWASVFAEVYPSVELDCVGKFRTQSRIKFRNVPELLTLLGECWDFVRGEVT